MEQRMPLRQYFSCVGGVLLAVLFILDAYFPKPPVVKKAQANLPVIRIHSDRKWPERVVYDTSLPTIVPASIASAEVHRRRRRNDCRGSGRHERTGGFCDADRCLPTNRGRPRRKCEN